MPTLPPVKVAADPVPDCATTKAAPAELELFASGPVMVSPALFKGVYPKAERISALPAIDSAPVPVVDFTIPVLSPAVPVA